MSFTPCLRLALVLVGVAPATAAQSVRLSGDLARLGTGDVVDVRFSSDGTRLVYRADQDADEVYELYSVPVDGSAPPVKLSGPLTAGGDVTGDFLPLGDRVVFRADAGLDGRFELFSAPVDGSAPRTGLSGTLVSGGNVFRFHAAPGGERVLFVADAIRVGRTAVFQVPVDGSAPRVRLDDDDNASAHVMGFSAGGSEAILGTYGFSRILRVPLDGSAPPVQIAQATCSTVACLAYPNVAHPSPDGTWLFYEVAVVDDEIDPTVLWGVPFDGSAPPTLLSLDDGFTGAASVVPTPDSQGVFFLEGYPDPDALIEAQRDGTRVQRNPPGTLAHAFALSPDLAWLVFEASGSLYRAPVDGSSAPVLLAGPGVQPDLAISADSATVVYAGVDAGTGFHGLFSVPIDGSASPVLLNGPAPSEPYGLAIGDERFALAEGLVPARVVFREQRGALSGIELHSAPIDGSAAATALTGPLPAPTDVTRFVLSPDGTRAAHVADPRLDDTFELFTEPADGSAPAAVASGITPDGPVTGDVGNFLVLPAVNRALYRAMEASGAIVDLFSVRMDARGRARSLTEALGGTGNVQAVRVTPDETRAVFAYDPVDPGPNQLRVVPTDGSGDPLLLDTSVAGFVGDLIVAAGGTRLVYRGSDTTFYELRSVPLDASAPPLVLHPPGTAFSTVHDFAVAPDGSHIVFLADHDVRNVRELWSGSVLGGPVVKLSGPMVLSGDVLDFAISPDGAWVVYLADQLADGQDELFRVPIDGSAPARRISGLTPTGRDVSDFAFTPDGRLVVYRSDAVGNDRADLFVVPVQGPRPALGRPGGERRIEPRLLTGDETTPIQPDYVVTPDGRAVLYRAGPTAGRSLFRAALDGRTPPVRLNGPLVTGGNVQDFVIAPDAGLVVYRADELVNNTVELFTVPLDGGPSTRIVALTSPDDVLDFRIAPGEAEVFFLVRALGAGADDLYRVPLDGSALPRRVNRPLPVGGDVLEFEPLADGRVVYRADEIVDERFELFLGLAPQEPVRPATTPTRFVVR